ncbi:MAG: TRAP transporter substrate-binding protein [Deltaproteobacteria bacterium]|nr:TRAP transporter substrate-binding protein [Deltaproteobacteria bacterium]
MKKTLGHSTLVLISLVVCFSLAFTGNAFAYSKEKPMVLKAAIANPEMDVKARTIKRFGDMVEERTKGRVTFKYFYGASLIKKPAFVDGVSKGIADISTGPISFVTGKIPELSPFEIYGGYNLMKTLEMNRAVRPLLEEVFAKRNIFPVMVQYTGNTIFCHKEKILKKPSDWKGYKMRLGGRWQSTLGKMWGASPVFMPPSELYLALQRGVLDGFMLIYDITYGLKLYEVAPYITDTTLSNNIEPVTFNLKKWKSLTKEDREIIKQVAVEVEKWNFDESLKVVEKIKKSMTAKGAKIHVLTEEEKMDYAKDSYSLWPEVEKVSGPTGKKFIEILKQYSEQ